jgi:hypothetical protein
MDKIGEICRKRKQAHQKLLSLDSKVYRAFLDMEVMENVFAGSLSE